MSNSQERQGHSNLLLRKLAPRDLERLHPECVSLERGTVLFEAGSEVEHVYFPRNSMVSLVYTSKDGGAAEMATVGREGAVGFIGGLSTGRLFNRCIVQVAGEADRVSAACLRTAFAENGAVRELMLRYMEVRNAQVLQSVACNALHPVEARCCRWLLMTRDRTDSSVLPITQEFLAEMLGVQRPTVALVLKTLQAVGVIRRSRGQIEIADIAGVEELSCECYGLVHDYYEQALGPWDS